MSYVYTKFDVFVQILRVKSIKKKYISIGQWYGFFKELSSAIDKITCTHRFITLNILYEIVVS